MPKVVISTSSFGKYDSGPMDELKALGLSVVLNPHGRKLTADEVVELMHDAVGVVAGTELLNAEVIRQLKSMRVISRCGVGMDNVDIKAAEEAGIRVYNTPEGPTLAVAELTVGLILTLLRKVTQMDAELRGGIWQKRMGNLLHGKRVGILGFGRIGQTVARMLEPFGVELRYCDLEEKVCKLNCNRGTVEDILGWADIITLHMSQAGSCAPVIGKAEIEKMKAGAWLLNEARGGLVDEAALADALNSGKLAGAAIDVFDKEPYDGPLTKSPTAILTPHIGSYAMEGRISMERQSVENLIAGLTEAGVI